MPSHTPWQPHLTAAELAGGGDRWSRPWLLANRLPDGGSTTDFHLWLQDALITVKGALSVKQQGLETPEKKKTRKKKEKKEFASASKGVVGDE